MVVLLNIVRACSHDSAKVHSHCGTYRHQGGGEGPRSYWERKTPVAREAGPGGATG